jgi:hypothetical protein
MTLASPVFKAMLYSRFKEGLDFNLGARTEIDLPNDDAEAFVTLLHLIHGDIPKVSETVTLEQLTSIAVLVDKYRLQKLMGLASEKWVEAPKPSSMEG